MHLLLLPPTAVYPAMSHHISLDTWHPVEWLLYQSPSTEHPTYDCTTNHHSTTYNPRKFQSSLPTNLQALWTTLKLHTEYPIKALAQYISQDKGQILIVTDASLNTQKFSTFSWTIATATHKLWIGEGAIPGTRCGAHSGWSEGYGFLSAMIFLKKYLQATNYLPN